MCKFKSVVLPATLNHVGRDALSDIGGLTTIYVPADFDLPMSDAVNKSVEIAKLPREDQQ